MKQACHDNDPEQAIAYSLSHKVSYETSTLALALSHLICPQRYSLDLAILG